MNILPKIISTLILGVGAVLLVAVAPTASADVKDACDKYTGDPAAACAAGYNNKNVTCTAYTGINNTACTAGKAQAEKDGVNEEETTPPPTGGTKEGESKCGGAKTEIVNCEEDAGLGAIASLIKTAIMIVTIIIGIVAVGGVTYAAILYASARDNQSQVQEAIGIIRNVVIGLVMYGLSVAIINWLIPGGVIG